MTEDGVEAAVRLASEQDGVLTRAQARQCGMDRWAVGHQVEQGRWRAHGRVTVAVHPLALSDDARVRASVWEAGERAVLDGSSALRWHGLTGFADSLHVLVPWPASPEPWRGSVVHSSRLWAEGDVVVVRGLAVTRPDVAAVHAALWARSDRAAATVLAMAVQQRLAPAERLVLEAKRINRHKRRPFVLQVAHDIADGAQALSELDFTTWCRRRELPAPSRQVLRKGPRGRVYLDVSWDEYGVAVEIEGAHHDAPEHAIDDALRQNQLTVDHVRVLRIPVLGLRSIPDRFMDQVEAMLRRAGWDAAA